MKTPRTGAVPLRVPSLLRKSIVFRWPDSRAAVLSILWSSPARWRTNPARHDDRWGKIRIGRFILAVKLDSD